ncbi:16S rRNA (guanine(966)-N(2))-methyltransferase RsmD [Nocardioides sp. zg-536]|uniref:16S rRNA (Guanine(966)-N(2))-methyltransferase RsmD n=1 Tax=Nocardioides faecalis TaxID=2803858 RepID=A0A938YAT8_9ACTN|nr:16S rRNA (guanine(966)-N(2))-methyltransferase RsmD [Nocardioides faecalis]MBM9460444.1 16S rRNA (guanine(966)-N(2))-methyltransferase RsmD [Nocardioides faecalis]QVI59736.1 16S rRNA (guanine(966)-N(2))-methyltransferase RsmD [Nocardioides faecalis]
MTRIIAGSAGGRRLQTPRGDATRPTSDRVREALLSAVDAWAGSLRGLRVLDLYAGSGAVGLEAWSRGAEAVTLVESDRRTADLVRANARAVGCPVAEVIARSVSAFLASAPRAPYDLVFADPPYPLADDAVAEVLGALVEGGWLSDDALVVVERSGRSPEPAWPAGLVPLPGRRGAKRYGETTLWFAEHPAEDAAGE